MPRTVFQSYENANAGRNYPFMDNADRTSVTGLVLPAAAVIDASVLCARDDGGIYISELSDNLELVFAKIAGGAEVGRAVIGLGVCPIYSDAGNSVGAVVMGEAWTSLKSAAPQIFNSTATAIVPSCLLATPATGLLSINLPTGERIAGDVEIVAGTGVEVSTVGNGVRIDFVGSDEPEDICGIGRPVIKTICVEVWEGSTFSVAHSDGQGTLNMAYEGRTLDEVCATANYGKLPDSSGRLPGATGYEDALGRGSDELPAHILTGRTLLDSFEVDVASVNGTVTFTSFNADGESVSRLRVTKSGAHSITLDLIGG